MNIEFADTWLEQLANGEEITTHMGADVIRAYQRKIQFLIAAPDERTLIGNKGLGFEKLRKELKGKYSVRVNQQFRIVFAIRPGINGNVLVIEDLTDYH